MRYLYTLLCLCAVLVCAPSHQAVTGTLNHRIPQTSTPRPAESDRPILIQVDTGMIEKLPVARDLISKIHQLPYVSKEPVEGNSWQVRIRLDDADKPGAAPVLQRKGPQLIVEREGGAVLATIPVNDSNLATEVSSALEREARWRIIRALENDSRNSTIRIEMRVVLVEVEKLGQNGLVEEVRDPVKNQSKPRTGGRLSEGDLFAFEIRNVGTTDAYVSIVDLEPDGAMHPLFPNPAIPKTENKIAPDGEWHRIPPPYVYRIVPPYGREVFKIVATKEPLPTDAFEGEGSTGRGGEAFRGLFGSLLKGASVSQAKLFGTSDWGTASLTFQVGPKKDEILAVTETDTPKTTLHILAVGINHYQNASTNHPQGLGDLNLAVKDARDFATGLERVGRNRFEKINTKLILNTEATRDSISATFERMITEAEPEDTFVFFYAGNGATTKPEAAIPSQFCLLPSDFSSKGNEPTNSELTGNGISAALLQSWLTKIQSRHQLIVLDTSHSDQGFETLVSRIAQENKTLRGLLQRDMVIVANALESYELENKGNGALTYMLLQGLTAGADEAREITARTMARSAREFPKKELYLPLEIKTYEAGADFPLGYASKKGPATNGATKLHHAGPKASSFDTPIVAVDLESVPGAVRRFRVDTNGLSSGFVTGDFSTNYLPGNAPQEPSKKRADIVGSPATQDSAAPRARTGKDYALLIAINDYDNWPHLDNPVPDAEAIADELKNYYGFETEVLKNPKKEEIISALLRYKRDMKYADDDQLFIFFAGHGSFSEEFKEGYIIAKDSQAKDLLGDSYLSHSILRKVIDYIPCKHIFLVLDACFSGTFDEKIARRGPDPEYENATNLQFIAEKRKWETRRFLTSGDKVYVPDGRPGQHSPFTRKLLEAFRSYGGKEGILTITGILSHVERVIPEPRQGEFGANQPGSDFLFIARKPESKTP